MPTPKPHKPKPTRLQLACHLRAAADRAATRHTEISSDLSEMCAIMSTLLKQLFEKHGYAAILVHGVYGDPLCGHCWVVSNGVIYDLTLTQFEKCEKVAVIHYRDKRRRKYRASASVLDTRYFNWWPKNQQPSRKNCQRVTSIARQLSLNTTTNQIGELTRCE